MFTLYIPTQTESRHFISLRKGLIRSANPSFYPLTEQESSAVEWPVFRIAFQFLRAIASNPPDRDDSILRQASAIVVYS